MRCPIWVKLAPFIAMLAGLALAYQFYIRRPDCRANWPNSRRRLYQFLLNKWYFDEIYDFIFVDPHLALGRFLWKRGDTRYRSTAGSTGVAMGIMPFLTRLAGRAQSGYIFTYAFAMVLGHCGPAHLDDALRGSELMDNLLSIITFLPLMGAVILALFLRGDDAAAQRNAKWVALVDDRGDLHLLAVHSDEL